MAKYRREHGAFKMVDAVNLVRPKATPALSKLVRGELAPAQTWETKLTQAGDGDTAGQVAAAKSQAWGELVRERKLGYLALLRNVRNILTQAPELVDELCQQLADERAVHRSLVFPFQFLSAVEVLKQGNLPGASRVMEALNAAIDHSLANVPKFEGKLRPEGLRHAPVSSGARLLPLRLERPRVRDHAEARPRSGGARPRRRVRPAGGLTVSDNNLPEPDTVWLRFSLHRPRDRTRAREARNRGASPREGTT